MATLNEQIVTTLFGDVDVTAISVTLDDLKLPLAYSDESVAKIDAAVNALADKAADLKKAEAPRAKRKAIRDEIEALLQARGFLYRLRIPQPGDVTTNPAPIGGRA